MRRQDPCIEIEITHPQLQAFKQPQTAAEQQVDYEVMGYDSCLSLASISARENTIGI